MKEINLEWMNEVLKERNTGDYSGSGPQIDWVQNRKGFKRNLKFKMLRANSKENNIFAHIIYTHWIDNPNGGPNYRMVCPEQTPHLKKMGVKCPICEAKRQLKAMGFTDEELSKQGKFGPIPVFDANITSNVKVVVIDSDLKHDWDKAHISVLQQKGTGLTRWLLEQYKKTETPDFMDWERSNVIEFSRSSDNGSFDRQLTFQTFEPTPEIIDKLKEENEAITMPDLWKMPTDEDFIQMKGIMDDMIKDYVAAKNTLQNAQSAAINVNDLNNQQPQHQFQQSVTTTPVESPVVTNTAPVYPQTTNVTYTAPVNNSPITDDDIPF